MGHAVIEEVARFHAEILFDNPGNLGLQVFQFRDAIRSFVEEHNIASVGGSYPVIRVRGNEFQPFPQSTKTHRSRRM